MIVVGGGESLICRRPGRGLAATFSQCPVLGISFWWLCFQCLHALSILVAKGVSFVGRVQIAKGTLCWGRK
jgi:hypothetical protein